MEKNKRQTLITGAIVLAIILVISIGTYAFITWTSSNIGIAGTADCFDVKYIKGEDIGSEDNPAEFTLASKYTEGLSSSLSVYLKSTCSIAGGNGTLYLNIDLDSTSDILLGNGILNYQVLDGTTEVSSGVVEKKSAQAIYNNISITRDKKTLTIYLWIDGSKVNNDNIEEVLTSSFKGNISLSIESNETYGEIVNLSLSEQTLNNLNTLNSSIKVDTSKTPNFSKISGESGIDSSNATVDGDGTLGIYTAEDDDGISYYFRGAVDNNYVSFANYLWRIIRINGDGSIRMIYYGKVNSDGTYDIDYAIGTSAYNENYNDNAYVGYMYGTAGSSTYEDTHSNTNDSTIKTYVDNWYNTNLKTYETYIQSTTYCNDRSITPVDNFMGSVALTGNGIGTEDTAYSDLTRTYINDPETPTLKCANENDRLQLKIGLVTTDEVVLAGAKGMNVTTYSFIKNTDFYLYSDAYLTMTPAFYYSGANVFKSSSFLSNDNVNNTGNLVRPVVSLSSDAITGGQGTETNPFTIG